MSNQQREIPAGYVRKANGDLTPVDNLKDIDVARDGMIYPLIDRAREISSALQQLKAHALDDVAAFVSLAAEQHGMKMGGKHGNVQLTTFDGRYKIERVNAKIIKYNESILAAQALFEESLAAMSEGAGKDLRTVTMLAFKKTRNGELRIDRLIELINAKVDDPTWGRACIALKECLYVSGTATYVRFYERIGQTEKYKLINLDLAGVSA